MKKNTNNCFYLLEDSSKNREDENKQNFLFLNFDDDDFLMLSFKEM